MVTKKKKRLWTSAKVRKAISLKACDYFLDLSKLVFAGIVLVTVMGYKVDEWIMLVGGVASTLILGILGFVLYIISKK